MHFLQYEAGPNDRDRRMDRIVRRFLPHLPLTEIYRAIRKGFIKVNGKKVAEHYRVREGDALFVADFLAAPQPAPAAPQAPLPRHPATAPTGSAAPTAPKSPEQTAPARTTTPESLPRTAPASQLEVLFRNGHVLALNKPYNMNVQKSRKDDIALDTLVRAAYTPTDGSLSFSPGPLHRLDRKTTGVIVFSQSLAGAREFGNLLQSHRITKEYLAVVQGTVPAAAEWRDFIAKEPFHGGAAANGGTAGNRFYDHGGAAANGNAAADKDRFHTVTVRNTEASDAKASGAEAEYRPAAKEAITTVEPLATGTAYGSPFTLCRVTIVTGRTHQIRSQLAFHGYPLLGDTAYGGKPINAEQSFFLHAYRLAAPENSIGLPQSITAPLPEPFQKFIARNAKEHLHI